MSGMSATAPPAGAATGVGRLSVVALSDAPGFLMANLVLAGRAPPGAGRVIFKVLRWVSVGSSATAGAAGAAAGAAGAGAGAGAAERNEDRAIYYFCRE